MTNTPFHVITPDHVRASIQRAKRSLDKAAEEIVWQIEMESWVTLGYGSWTAMREAEYGGAAFMVPAKNRPELVARIRATGLTQRETANTIGVTERTIQRDDAWANTTNVVLETEKADPVAAESAPTYATCTACGGTGRITQ